MHCEKLFYYLNLEMFYRWIHFLMLSGFYYDKQTEIFRSHVSSINHFIYYLIYY